MNREPEGKSSRIPHLAKNERDVGHPSSVREPGVASVISSLAGHQAGYLPRACVRALLWAWVWVPSWFRVCLCLCFPWNQILHEWPGIARCCHTTKGENRDPQTT